MVSRWKVLLVRVPLIKFFIMPSLESSVLALESEIHFNSKSELVALGFPSLYRKMSSNKSDELGLLCTKGVAVNVRETGNWS